MLNKIFLIFIICHFTWCINLHSQELIEKPIPKKNSKEIGVNITNFISQFVPFGNNAPNLGPFSYSYKYYGSAAAFRFGLGMNISSLENNFDDFFLNIRIGYEKRKHINNKWAFTRGMDLAFFAGDESLNTNNTGDAPVILGIGPMIGIEFYIWPNVYLSTENFIFFGLGSSSNLVGLNLIVFPPKNLMLHVKL
jgi:hypothetical protein